MKPLANEHKYHHVRWIDSEGEYVHTTDSLHIDNKQTVEAVDELERSEIV